MGVRYLVVGFCPRTARRAFPMLCMLSCMQGIALHPSAPNTKQLFCMPMAAGNWGGWPPTHGGWL